jgi:hypothetical protein
VLVEEVPVLDEPRVADPMRALARIATPVECSPLAIGTALGQVGSAVRRGYDANVRVAVGAQLAELPSAAPPRCASGCRRCAFSPTRLAARW